MKALYFNAVSGHPKVTGALMRQAYSVLRPFNQYLRQAIHTAQARQTRYRLPWEPVQDLTTVHLDPIDTALRLPRPAPGLILMGWSGASEPDLDKPAFVINRSLPVQIHALRPTAGGLRAEASPPLEAGDTLMWCQEQLTVEAEEQPEPPRALRRLDGSPLPLRRDPIEDGEEHWRVVVEGSLKDGPLRVDDAEVHAQSLEEFPRQVVDAEHRAFSVTGRQLRVEELPAEGELLGDNGIRYAWRSATTRQKRGRWVQLLPPERGDSDEAMDPRAAFCEGDVREVWTQARHHRDGSIKVFKVDSDRYQLLLEKLPPKGVELFLPVDTRNLYLQQRALNQLTYAPLPHHQGLLRLCEDPQYVRWPRVRPPVLGEEDWRALKDLNRSGTLEQRRFVAKALGSPDFAFLEGPPGSGKTTSIVEIVHQLALAGQRILLCASTHVAIDNVLERLIEGKAPIDAVRVGRLDRVDETVAAFQLDQRIDSLLNGWREDPRFSTFGNEELKEMAERTVIMSSNLTCGTTMGIVNHPLFQGRDRDIHVSRRPIASMPHWDVLIIDEASKTLIQEFMVPALMAKRWIIVGDVQQLPPFTDRADIVANLRDLINEKDKPIFPSDHQRACLLRYRMVRRRVRQRGMRWLMVEPPGVLDHLANELEVDREPGLSVARVVRDGRKPQDGIAYVTVTQLKNGTPEALALYAADWVLVADDLLPKVADLLPSNLLQTQTLLAPSSPIPPSAPLHFKQAWYFTQAGALPKPYSERRSRGDDIQTLAQSQENEADWLSRNDLAQELAWRITRLHELRSSANRQEPERLQEHLAWLSPKAVDIGDAIGEIQDIGLPSILEVLQRGIGVERSSRRSALTAGFATSEGADFDHRFESLVYQHRMHPDISTFPREIIYAGKALKDANTIAHRDKSARWDFGPFRARRVWLHVPGRERGGVNGDEIDAMLGVLKDFIAWARQRGAPEGRPSGVWEVACLTFYTKQEGALSDALRTLTGDNSRTRFKPKGAPVEIVCGTVDRFQGREADLVLLSMRNTRRVGFLDSPNRLNVAVTRARQQLIVVGNALYFKSCRVAELEALVKRSPQLAYTPTARRNGP